MARSNDVHGESNYDFFENQPTQGYALTAQGYAPAPGGGQPVSSAARWIGRFATLFGWLSVAGVVVIGILLLAPGMVPALEQGSTLAWTVAAIVCWAASLLLTIVAKVMGRRRIGRRAVASGAVVALVFAAVLSGGVALASNMFPDGIVTPSVRDEAPADDDSSMQQGLEQVAGATCSTWQEQNVSGYPGVKSVALCTDAKVAYVTFDTVAAASMYRSLVISQVQNLLSQNADNAEAQGEWSVVNGDTWMVVGQRDVMEKLQEQWGGTLEDIQ